MMERAEQIRAGLAEVEERIAAACAAAGRERDDVNLIVVTKTHPASDVSLLAAAGVTDVGENRHPEAGRKRAEVPEDLRWHFVGGLQTNKAAAVAGYADMVHSVDRARLVDALARGARSAEKKLACLVQVDFALDNPGRSGIAPAGVLELAELIASNDHLEIAGVMTVAPLGADPTPAFERLYEISQELQAVHPDARVISAGMSEDLEQAIASGATHVRIGRSILGQRA